MPKKVKKKKKVQNTYMIASISQLMNFMVILNCGFLSDYSNHVDF